MCVASFMKRSGTSGVIADLPVSSVLVVQQVAAPVLPWAD